MKVCQVGFRLDPEYPQLYNPRLDCGSDEMAQSCWFLYNEGLSHETNGNQLTMIHGLVTEREQYLAKIASGRSVNTEVVNGCPLYPQIVRFCEEELERRRSSQNER